MLERIVLSWGKYINKPPFLISPLLLVIEQTLKLSLWLNRVIGRLVFDSSNLEPESESRVTKVESESKSRITLKIKRKKKTLYIMSRFKVK